MGSPPSFLAVATLVHIVRLTAGWPVRIGTASVPPWVSLVAVVLGALGAAWGFVLLGHQIRRSRYRRPL